MYLIIHALHYVDDALCLACWICLLSLLTVSDYLFLIFWILCVLHSIQHNARGMLAMANSGPNTNGSQFFITYAKQPHLNGLYTIFGKVIHGFEVLDLMEKVCPDWCSLILECRVIYRFLAAMLIGDSWILFSIITYKTDRDIDFIAWHSVFSIYVDL